MTHKCELPFQTPLSLKEMLISKYWPPSGFITVEKIGLGGRDTTTKLLDI